MRDWDDDGNGVGGNAKEQAKSCGLDGEGGYRNTATVFLEEAYRTSILRRYIVRIQEIAVQV